MRSSWLVDTGARRTAPWRLGKMAVAVAALAAVSAPAFGVTRRVPADFPTIHQALAVSTTADSVLVAPGVWSATTTRSVTTPSGPVTYVAAGFLPHGVTLISEGGPAATSIVVTLSGSNVRGLVTDPLAGAGTARVIGFTFRKPNATGAAIVAHGTATSNLAVESCRFENISGATEAGGIYATAGDLSVSGSVFSACASTTRGAGITHVGAQAAGDTLRLDLADCEFSSCTGGGGVHTLQAELRASNCLFQGGSMSGGQSSGIYGEARRLELDDCRFVDNVAPFGAVINWSRAGSSGWVRGCVVARNNAAGGALYLQGLSGDVSRNTFVANFGGSALGTGALGMNTGTYTLAQNVFADHLQSPAVRKYDKTTLTQSCNIYWNNTVGHVVGFTMTASSRILNPQFCDAAAGDYSLHSTSPCLSENSLSCGAIGALGAGCGPYPYVIRTHPIDLNVRVDGALVATPHTPSWNPGEQHQIQVITPYDNGSARSWAFSSWSDGSTDTTRTVTVPLSPVLWQIDYVDEPKATIIVRTSPLTTLPLRIDGQNTTGPATRLWHRGSVHTIEARTPFAPIEIGQHLFESWSHGAERIFSYTVPAAGGTTEFTANYTFEPYPAVTVTSDPPGRVVRFRGVNRTEPYTIALRPGSSHSASVTTPQFGPGNIEYWFLSWSDGGERSHNFVMPASPFLLSANFETITIDGVFLETSPPGLTIDVDGTPRTAPVFVALTAGTTHELLARSGQILSNTRYRFVSWEDSTTDSLRSFLQPSGRVTVTATFEVHPFDGVFLRTSPAGLKIDLDGTARTAPVFVPLTAGTTHELLARSGQILSNTRYNFLSWDDGSTDSLRSFLQLSEQDTVTAAFEADLSGITRVTLQTSPSGLPLVVDGGEITTPQTLSLTVGTQHLLEARPTFTEGTSTHRFHRWSHNRPREHFFTAPLADVTWTANYTTEHALTMVVDPTGSVLPGTSYVIAGVPLEIRAIPDPKYFFIEWIAEGLGSYTGTDNPATIIPQGPITEVARFGLVAYDFALSLSSETHTVHTGSPLGFGEVYLWFVCGTGQGFSILETRAIGSMQVLGFAPEPGIFNLGGGTDARILVETCPTTPTLLGRFFVLDPGGGTLCLGPSAATGRFEVVDCTPGHEFRYPWPDDLRVMGVTTGTDPFCVSGRACGQAGDPIPVRLSSFGAVERDGGVDVTWTTSFEARHEGFRVYRSSDADSRPRALHEGLLDGESPYLFRDANIVPDMRYWYLLGAFDYGGAETRYGPIAITTSPARPLQFGFAAVHPNPFVERAVLQFTLAKPGRAHVDAFDVAGRLVGRVLDGVYPAGDHSAAWDGRDDRGRRLAAGIYFLRLKTDADSQTRRVVMLGTR